MKVYPLGIVGERNYQDAIKRCEQGEPVKICVEPDNPYDALALRVDSSRRETIGYIPKSSWLRDAVHEKGRGVTATIMDIKAGDGEFLGVVLAVTLTDDDLPERRYSKAKAAPAAAATAAAVKPMRKIFKSIFK